jgi:hypothetical protein
MLGVIYAGGVFLLFASMLGIVAPLLHKGLARVLAMARR